MVSDVIDDDGDYKMHSIHKHTKKRVEPILNKC